MATTGAGAERAKTLASVSDDQPLMRQVFAMQDQAAAADQGPGHLKIASLCSCCRAKQRDLTFNSWRLEGMFKEGATAAKQSDTLAG